MLPVTMSSSLLWRAADRVLWPDPPVAPDGVMTAVVD